MRRFWASLWMLAGAAGVERLRVRLGDAGLVKTFLDRLGLPPAWRRRLELGNARGATPSEFLRRRPRNGDTGAGVLAALSRLTRRGRKRSSRICSPSRASRPSAA